jgi:hypothetical protein
MTMPYPKLPAVVTKLAATNSETNRGNFAARGPVYISVVNAAGGATLVTLAIVQDGGTAGATNRFAIPVGTITWPFYCNEAGEVDVYTQTDAGTADVYIFGGG